jgi:hypothetical protein
VFALQSGYGAEDRRQQQAKTDAQQLVGVWQVAHDIRPKRFHPATSCRNDFANITAIIDVCAAAPAGLPSGDRDAYTSLTQPPRFAPRRVKGMISAHSSE